MSKQLYDILSKEKDYFQVAHGGVGKWSYGDVISELGNMARKKLYGRVEARLIVRALKDNVKNYDTYSKVLKQLDIVDDEDGIKVVKIIKGKKHEI